MVKVGLCIKANLSNVDKFYPCEPETFAWLLKIKCTGCLEEDPKFHPISEDQVFELATTKANFFYKCKNCHRENNLSVIPSNHVNKSQKGSHKTHLETVYNVDDNENFKTIISFDCRGLELVDYEPGEGWAVQSGRKKFDNVDLSTKEWFDYNDIDGVPVEITEFDHKFVILK